MANLIVRSQSTCFGGTVGFYEHQSWACRAPMRFAVFVPPQPGPRPGLYFLSGLTCTEENFFAKAGAQRMAAALGLILIAPDTSPRATGIPGEDEATDLGSGAGFYLDATQDPWASHYQMYTYITQELPSLIAEHFPLDEGRQGLCGHSMGGHGALVCALRNPRQYRSLSAFAPIVAPRQCPWGQKAFTHYLGADQSPWRAYDATDLVLQRPLPYPVLIDQGGADPFLEQQLQPQKFLAACEQAGQDLQFHLRPGYDHSYYFVATFMADHLAYHAWNLGA